MMLTYSTVQHKEVTSSSITERNNCHMHNEQASVDFVRRSGKVHGMCMCRKVKQYMKASVAGLQD